MTDDIFSQIRDGRSPASIVYKNKYVTCFHDIHPDTPVHVLIIPNRKFETLADVSEDVSESEEPDVLFLGHMLLAAKKIAEQFSISSSGYRLIMNINHDGGQEVRYIHMHLVGGLRLGRMLSLPSSSKKKMRKLTTPPTTA